MGNVKALILKNGSSFFPFIQSPKGNEKKEDTGKPKHEIKSLFRI